MSDSGDQNYGWGSDEIAGSASYIVLPSILREAVDRGWINGKVGALVGFRRNKGIPMRAPLDTQLEEFEAQFAYDRLTR